MNSAENDSDLLRPHVHEPNPTPPSDDPSLSLCLPDGLTMRMGVEQLRSMPRTTVDGCFIVSTGHGTSGPFAFGGVTLIDLVLSCAGTGGNWSRVEVVSGDDFGTVVSAAELKGSTSSIPVLLSDTINGLPMTREQGLVRLIVPSETDDALRQVKWVSKINVSH